MNSLSSWYELKCRIAALLRMQDAIRSNKAYSREGLTMNEINFAEFTIIKCIQCKYYKNEINCINNNVNFPRTYSFRKLALFNDKFNMLRVGGRINNAMFSYDVKHPLILPPCFLSEFLIRDVHAGPCCCCSPGKRNGPLFSTKTI